MKTFVALSALALLCGRVFAAEAPARKPNILFIYTDDQRYDAFSAVQREQGERGRFPWFKTPNMDRLAAEGVRFRNAFVVNSLCAPSRAVNLTGRYNHCNGIASNFRPFPTNSVTHATLLREAGYTTAYIGKWHMDSQRERPGFDTHASFIGHARYVDPPFIVDGKDTPTQGWIDDLSTDYAIAFMRKQKDAANPWSMAVGLKSPHGPCTPPERAKDRFAGEQARAVPNLASPAIYAGQTKKTNSAKTTGPVPVSLDYFRCVSAADDCLGRLLDALDELGLASNTVVIFTSDNGYYLGEHGLGDKRSAYDESLRVPFIVRYPALGALARGRVRDEMVLNLDLAQSLLDLAGVPAPKEMQGQSWKPLLTGEPAAGRQSWFYEYFAENQKNSRVPDITAVRTADAKLSTYSGHAEWTELFDLKADPYELRNLFRDPASAALRERLVAEHAQLIQTVGYRVPEYVDRPEWWGLPGGPDALAPKPGLRLHFDFTKGGGTTVPDQSGLGNGGTLHEGTFIEGSEGHKALRLQGKGSVDVPKSKSLNPADSAWAVEVSVKPEQPDGMILARGGKSAGYALWLKQGRPVFTVNPGGKPVSVVAKDAVTGWATLTGTITGDRQITLAVDGKTVGKAPLPNLIDRDPNDTMQIGADLGSPVLDPAPPPFSGLIEHVRIFCGPAR
jgi:arylsulfatase A-like enzyme